MNSKKKGNKNERELAKWWKDWTGIEFSRVPSSGGLRWKKTDNITSDIICTDPHKSRNFKFNIETKFYKDINFEHLILKDNPKNIKIWEFWNQAKDDGKKANRIPILFMRYNSMPRSTWFVVVELRILNIVLKLLGKGVLEHTYFVVESPVDRVGIISSNMLNKVNYRKLHKYLRDGK